MLHMHTDSYNYVQYNEYISWDISYLNLMIWDICAMIYIDMAYGHPSHSGTPNILGIFLSLSLSSPSHRDGHIIPYELLIRGDNI